ncbi:hypothetical protein YC2023_002463 [Brassica napus]
MSAHEPSQLLALGPGHTASSFLLASNVTYGYRRSNDGIMPMVTTETFGNDSRYDRSSVPVYKQHNNSKLTTHQETTFQNMLSAGSAEKGSSSFSSRSVAHFHQIVPPHFTHRESQSQ